MSEFGASLKCMYVQEDVGSRPYFFVTLPQNRNWMMQTVKWIHEGGFMAKWNELAFHAEVNQNKKTFLEPATETITDSIKLNKLWSIFILCLML